MLKNREVSCIKTHFAVKYISKETFKVWYKWAIKVEYKAKKNGTI